MAYAMKFFFSPAKSKLTSLLFLFSRREYTISLHLVYNSWRLYARKIVPLHIEKEVVNFWMGKLSFSITLENER